MRGAYPWTLCWVKKLVGVSAGEGRYHGFLRYSKRKIINKGKTWITKATHRHEVFHFVRGVRRPWKYFAFSSEMYNEDTCRRSCWDYGKRHRFPLSRKERTYDWRNGKIIHHTLKWTPVHLTILVKSRWIVFIRVIPGILSRKREHWSQPFWKMSVNKNHECLFSDSYSNVFTSRSRQFENFKFVPYCKLYSNSLSFWWK